MRSPRDVLQVLALGLSATAAFPFVLPMSGSASAGSTGADTLSGAGGPPVTPLFDQLPREIFIFIAGVLLYRLVCGPHRLARQAFLAWLAGLVHFATLLYWLDIAMVHYGRMPQWQALPVISLLVAYCAAFWAALPSLTRLLVRHGRLPSVVAFPTALVLLEWLRSVLLTGFPWGLWGYSQARNLLLLQTASIVGVYGVSWLIGLICALLSEYFTARADCAKGTRAINTAGLRLLLVVLFVVVFGFVRQAGPSDADSGARVTVTVVQGNIEQSIKSQSPRHAQQIVDTYRSLTERAITDQAARGTEVSVPRVIVWPEAALPGFVRTEAMALSMPPLGVPLLTGAPTYTMRDEQGAPVGPAVAEGERGTELDSEIQREVIAHNSALWVDAGGTIGGRYDKQHLVPFGEYVPLRWLLPVERFVSGVTDFTAGQSGAPIGEPPFGILICFDGVFPEIARREVQAGSGILANLTNDAWYGSSSAPFQHRDFYILRAVETGRWVVRAANSGVSVFIDPDGRLHGETRLNEATTTTWTIEARSELTAYVRFGDWWLALCGLVAVWSAGSWAAFRLRRRR